MIILKDSANAETLTITTTTVADIDYSVSYADITSTTFSPSTSEGKIITPTTVTAVSAPGSSTQRQIKLITITNRHASTTNTVLVKKDRASIGDYYLTPVITLLSGETIQYMDGEGWTHYLANGRIQGTYAIPSGSSGQIQINSGNILGADSDLIFNSANNHIELGTVSNNGVLALGYNTTDTSAEAGKMLLYAKKIASRVLPKWIGPQGVDNPIQSCLGFNGIKQVAPATGTGATTCMTAFCTAFTNSATTYVQVPVTSTSIKTRMRSVTLATSGTAGNVASHRTAQYEVTGSGGYFFLSRFYVSGSLVTGQYGFHGLVNRTTAFGVINPLTDITSAKVGIGYALSGTTGNWQVVASNATTTQAMTPVDLGSTNFSVNTTDVIELALFCPPTATSEKPVIGYRVTNLTTSAVASGEISSNVPIPTVPLAVQHFVSNNATAAVATFGLNKWYLESDY